jgi:hypothetical protein
MLVNNDVNSLKTAVGSPGHRPVHVLEWMGLLPALGICAWVILNFG